MPKATWFERAIFISWYCSKRDCAFCYLSSNRVKADPIRGRRSPASILAEAIICKACGWEIEFLSGGCDTYNDEELLFLLKNIKKIYEKKLWLNVGILNESQLKKFKPYIEGVCGTVECITPKLRDKLCPSKPLAKIEKMFMACDKLKIKKTITLILGLGETISDFSILKGFIKKHKIERLTFYRLKPQKGTIFEKAKPITKEYYAEWLKKTRKAFPKMKIVAGSWLTHLGEIRLLLESGADALTKFPSIKMFSTKYAKTIEKEIKRANRKFIGTLTKMPEIDVDREVSKLDLSKKLKEDIKVKIEGYLDKMQNNVR